MKFDCFALVFQNQGRHGMDYLITMRLYFLHHPNLTDIILVDWFHLHILLAVMSRFGNSQGHFFIWIN